MDEDRRAAIEAAFESVEEAPTTPIVQEATPETPPVQANTEAVLEAEATPGETKEPEVPPAEEPEAKPAAKSDEVAPASWKAPSKSKWGELAPEVKQEVWRREKEVTRVLAESTSARQFAKTFVDTAAPFSARLQAQGVNPLQAFKQLLLADHRLSTGTKQQRAQLIAGMIKDYEIDIRVLDDVLAGTSNPAAAEEDRIARLLDQRLAPVQQQLQSYQARERAEEAATAQTFNQQIETMAANTKEFPFFENVRDAMADLVEINAHRGVSLDLKTAYNRAVAADPQLISQVESSRQSDQLKQAAQRAQRAKQASLSVNGAPAGGLAKSSVGNDRRATIAAAFDTLGE